MYDPKLDEDTIARLNSLIVLNAENARLRSRFISESERTAFGLMRRPEDFEHAFAAFGGFIGVVAPAAIFLSMSLRHAGDLGWLVAVFVAANILTAIVGYFLGSVVGKIARLTYNHDWITMMVFLTIVGGAWGLISGFIGGLVIFIVGAFFGGAIGMVVGALTLPVFAAVHRMINTAGYIERRQLIALAGGISMTAAAFIFGR